jgi:hypothetical protein
MMPTTTEPPPADPQWPEQPPEHTQRAAGPPPVPPARPGHREPASVGDIMRGMRRAAPQVFAALEAGQLPGASPDPDDDPRTALLAAKAYARQAAIDRAIPPGGVYEAAQGGIATLRPQQHPDAVRRWMANPVMLLLVIGGRLVGRGKTYLALAVAAEAATAGVAVRHRGRGVTTDPQVIRRWTQIDYLAALRPDGSKVGHGQIREEAHTAGLLVLDDLGAEVDAEATETARRELVSLIEARLAAGRRTVITTNLSPTEIRDRFGERLTNRLVDMTVSMTIKVEGDDLRQQVRELPDDW